jgi:uncharacterized protein
VPSSYGWLKGLGTMKIYRKVIPKIAKDIVRSLLANKIIEIEDGHRDEAEMDVAGVIVGYLNRVDKITEDAHEALLRHNLGTEHLGRIKKSLAQNRKVVLGNDALDFILDSMIEALFESRHVEEVFSEDHEIRTYMNNAMKKYVGVDEELDREVRGRLKNFREGTPEWELEYNTLIDRMRNHHQESSF